MTAEKVEVDPIVAYIAEFDAPVRERLQEMNSLLSEVLPECERTIAWRMPTYRRKKNIIHFAGFKQHVGLYPGPDAVEFFAPKLDEAGFKHSKGAIQFPYAQELPRELIQEIAKWCLSHIS